MLGPNGARALPRVVEALKCGQDLLSRQRRMGERLVLENRPSSRPVKMVHAVRKGNHELNFLITTQYG